MFNLANAFDLTAISPLYKLIWPLHVRIRGNWAESVSTLLKNGAIVRSLGDTGTKMAPSPCWDFKLSNEGSFVEIGQEMTKQGWKVWKKSLQSLRAELQSLRAESIAVCMQRWSFRRRSLSWETSFDWSEMKVRALPGVSPHPTVRTWPGFQIKWTQPDFSWFFMRTIPAAENRGAFRRRPMMCATFYRNPKTSEQLRGHLWPATSLKLLMRFSQKMTLY